MPSSTFLSSPGMKNGLTGATCARWAITAISAMSISIEFGIITITRSPLPIPRPRQIPREPGDGAAELRVGDAPLLINHRGDLRVRKSTASEQHVHEALILRQGGSLLLGA